MKKANVLSLWLASALTACTAVKPDLSWTALEPTVASYYDHLRWGHYEEAAGFRNPHFADLSKIDQNDFKEVHISGYQVVQKDIVIDRFEAKIAVVLEYYDDRNGKLHNARDEKTWGYDAGSKRWYLDGDLPDFLLNRR